VAERGSVKEQPLVVEQGGLRIGVGPRTGAIQEFSNEQFDLAIRPERAESWRLLVPLPDRRGHYVYGRDQQLRSAETSADSLRLVWGPLETEVGSLDVEVALAVHITRGEAIFELSLSNRCPYVVEEAIAPCLAGITRPADSEA
jgi:hypothetical protein